MSELTERLRSQSRYTQGQVLVTMYEAATMIEKLESENARLKTVPMKYRRMEFNAQLQERLAALERRLECYSDNSEYFGFAIKAELLPILRGETE